jgi:hypothetical protein
MSWDIMALSMLLLYGMKSNAKGREATMSEQESTALPRYRMCERWRSRAARLAAKRWRQHVAGVKSMASWARDAGDGDALRPPEPRASADRGVAA